MASTRRTPTRRRYTIERIVMGPVFSSPGGPFLGQRVVQPFAKRAGHDPHAPPLAAAPHNISAEPSSSQPAPKPTGTCALAPGARGLPPGAKVASAPSADGGHSDGGTLRRDRIFAVDWTLGVLQETVHFPLVRCGRAVWAVEVRDRGPEDFIPHPLLQCPVVHAPPLSQPLAPSP